MITQIKGRLKTKELEDGICRLIVQHNLQAGDPILSEYKLVDMFGVSRVTVRQALARLVEKGILYKEQGKGTFVNDVSSIRNDSGEERLTQTIVVIGNSISNSYFANLARGAEDAARRFGCNLSFCSTDGWTEKEELYICEMLKRGVAGVLLSPAESSPYPPIVRELCQENENIVIINSTTSGIKASCVSSDDREGGYLATRHLIELGHRKIAHIRGPRLVVNAQEREDGYRRALIEAGIHVNEKLIIGKDSFSKLEGCMVMDGFLQLPASERPSAVFAASDMLAWGAYETLQKYDLQVPDDMSLVGYGDLLETARMGIELTSVKQHGYEIGKTAVSLLLGETETKNLCQKIMLPTELVCRKSCKEHTKV